MKTIGDNNGFDMTTARLNLIKHRGDPKNAVLESGHKVEKQEYIYFTVPSDGNRPAQAEAVKCAEYHGEHFIYADPLYEEQGDTGRGRWFAMCTCGSPAVLLTGAQVKEMGISEDGKQLAVCYFYTSELVNKGEMNAKHQTGYIKRK